MGREGGRRHTLPIRQGRRGFRHLDAEPVGILFPLGRPGQDHRLRTYSRGSLQGLRGRAAPQIRPSTEQPGTVPLRPWRLRRSHADGNHGHAGAEDHTGRWQRVVYHLAEQPVGILRPTWRRLESFGICADSPRTTRRHRPGRWCRLCHDPRPTGQLPLITWRL